MHNRLHLLKLERENGNSEIETWAFSCPVCAYRGFYRIDIHNGDRELKIIARGNEDAFHYSNHLFSLLMENFVWKRPEKEEEFNWDSWLNPGIREQLNQILSDFDEP